MFNSPSMMNGAMYQQLLAMMQGGGSAIGGSMPQLQNMAPQIAQQPRTGGSNISPVPQMQRQQQGPPGGQLGSAVNAGENMQKLYGMGQSGYNNIAGMFNGQQQPSNANPNAVSGAPVANNQAGNNYLQNNPYMMSQGAQPSYFGNMSNNQAYMAGQNPNYSGLPQNQMFGSMGASGMNGQTFGNNFAQGSANSMFGQDSVADYGSASAGGSSWLDSIWDYL